MPTKTGAPGKSRTSNGLGKKRRCRRHQKIVDRTSGVIGVPVGHELPRLIDDRFAWRPDAEERAFVWRGEPPPFDEFSIRATYDLNKELADDLRRDVAVVVGSPYIRTSSKLLFRRKIKERR